jgi:hypothetical protein
MEHIITVKTFDPGDPNSEPRRQGVEQSYEECLSGSLEIESLGPSDSEERPRGCRGYKSDRSSH